MPGYPAVLLLLFLVAGVLVFAVRSVWRDRTVDFLDRLSVGSQTSAVAALLFDRAVPVLVDRSYKMVARGGHTTILERRFFPVWTIWTAVLLFPVGLVALLARGHDVIVIVEQDGVVELHGRSGKLDADFVVVAAHEAADDCARRLAAG